MPPQAMILRFYLTMGLLCYVLSHPLRQGTNAALYRGLGGLLGEDDDPLIPSESEMDTALPQPHHLTIISHEGLGGFLTVEGNNASSVQATDASSASRPSSTTNSTLGGAQSASTATITSPIGIVAAVMLSIVFFDSWWGFLRALGTEDMVPDWARRDWEFKIASEDGHRYPTLSSLEFMSKPKPDPALTSPLMPMSPDLRHLPLFRRPSASNHTMPYDPKA
ncbi:hypothetical protein DFH09DRAFT_1211627 [Mycena vulgaris]|nr:hypothetical protein DFH09DRAFT_1211627 [Mycena vulgaris]